MARLILPVLVFGSMLFPSFAYAADATFFGPILPRECKCEDVRGPDGTIVDTAPEWGCVLATAGNVINFTISIGVIIFILVVMYAGVLFMTSPFKAENRELGRSILMNAVIGIVIMLSAWILIDFVMKTVYKGSSQEGAEFGPWNSILSGNETSYCILPTAQPQDDPLESMATDEATGITDAQARSAFSNAGFTFSSTRNCSENRTGCTYLGGLQGATINTIASLGRACGQMNYQMVITGGTEPGHSNSHRRGYKIDVRDNAAANQCIQHFTERYPAGDRGGDHGGEAWIDECGNVFVREDDHWDILVTNQCTYD